MAKNTSQAITERAIAVAVLKKRPQVIALFKKNGIIASSSWTDHELIVGILQAMAKNERFRADLAELLTTVTLDNKSHFTGEGMFRFTGENMFRLSGTLQPLPGNWHAADGQGMLGTSTDHPTIFDVGPTGAVPSGSLPSWATVTPSPAPAPMPATAASTSSSGSGSFLSGVFNASTISNILNQGVNVLSTSLQNKSNAQLANTALQIEQQKTAQAALAAGGVGGTKPPMSTGAKIGIGILIVVGVGLATWGVVALVRRHKRARAA